ncbi:3'-phosphoadenosine 5'-phosphosulfate sulfotransferase [Sorochytrium milnesiophthora]
MFPRIDVDAVQAQVYRFVRRSVWQSAAGGDAAITRTSLPRVDVSRLEQVITEAVSVIERAVVDYGVPHLAMSFNGGKDCTVLVYLYVAVLSRYWRHASVQDSAEYRIPTMYITCERPFPEIEDFVIKCTHRYRLDMIRLAGPMKCGLEEFLRLRPATTAVLIGTRRTDPFAENLQPFSPCDPGWPTIMRVNPILDWDYSDIWLFLYALNVEYSVLYDRGFTSLGSVDNTLPNPALATPEGGFLPAWHLRDAALERDGRVKQRPAASVAPS